MHPNWQHTSNFGYNSQLSVNGGKSACSHGHAHGPCDMPLMSINLEFSSDIRHQSVPSMPPSVPTSKDVDHLHLKFQYDQLQNNLQRTNCSQVQNLGTQNCCCHHLPLPHFSSAPSQEVQHYSHTRSHPHQWDLSRQGNSQPLNQSHPMNQPQRVPMSLPQPASYQYRMNPSETRNNVQSYMCSQFTPTAPPTPKHYLPNPPSIVNCANINISIGGVSCLKDRPVTGNPVQRVSYVQNFHPAHMLDKKCFGQRMPSKNETHAQKCFPVNDEYRNSLNAIARSHAEWFGHTDGASQVNSSSLFNSSFAQHSSVMDSPWLPSNLDDKDFRLVLIFLQNSRQPIHYPG